MNQEYLQDFINGAAERKLNVLGVVVRQHNKIIASHEFVPSERIQIFSASKTFTSIATGIAIGEGYFKINDRFVDLLKGMLPEKLPDGFDKLTVWHLLTMSTGHHECPIFKMQNERRKQMEAQGVKMPGPGEGTANSKSGNMSDGWFDAFISEPLTEETGVYYTYNNGASYMLSLIVQTATGKTLLEYLRPRIFDPLGIKNVEWDQDSRGFCLGAIGLHLNTEELSRAGQLILNRGVWEGKQLIPADYVDQMRSKQVDNSHLGNDPDASAGYGFQMWMCSYPQAARFDGMFGQYSIVLPTLDAVVAITSHQMGNTLPIVRLVWDTITPKLEKTV